MAETQSPDMEIFDAPVAVDDPAPAAVIKDKDYLYSGRKSFSVWLDWTEWQAVFADLFPVELNLGLTREEQQARKLRALAYMAAWRARSDVPVAIEVTAHLAEISCHDNVLGLATPGRSMYRSHEELRLLYSATVVRCVNGLVDASQRGAYAQAVSALAMRIGIPLWIVDIRHEAAHTKLPSLPTLQLAAQTLRQWLFEHYWQPQDSAIKARVARVGTALARRVDAAEPLNTLLALDVATLSTIVAPLLVQGHQFNHWVSPDGLIMDRVTKEGVAVDMTRFEDDWLDVCHQAPLLAVVEECQANWEGFDGFFLVALAREVCRVRADAAQDVKVALLVKWMLLVASPWPCAGPRLPLAAKEALHLMGTDDEHQGDSVTSHYLQRVRTALASLAATTYAKLNRSDDAKADTWTRCAAWTPSPMGIQTPFGPVPRDLALGDNLDAWDAGHMLLLEEAERDESVGAYETAYFASMDALVAMDRAIADEIVQMGQTSQSEAISADEVNRLQDAIEIW
ncbi:Aste57867_16392 [Aphanomyces stellatus]|uniref:Aste57867_16392 protein n=1 Tax=Aphanomyces stellatus TaxID=120398 RepID=A0A485L660_9STRA|nr:hypothetical protein As57867_016335 [Aphanomyces stellatus]VFT93168.1 Aste57867_16392 [Aphanomyces stellatus]